MPRVFASSLARCLVATPLAAPVRIWPMRSDWRMERSSPVSGAERLAATRGGGRARTLCAPGRPAEVLGGHTAGGAGAHLAHAVGLEDGEELAGFGVEEHGVEAGAAAGDRVGLEAEGVYLGGAGEHDVQAALGEGDPATAAGGGPRARGAGGCWRGGAGEHDVQAALGEGDPATGAVGGPALGLLVQDGLDRVERRGHVEEPFDLVFGKEQRHEPVPLFVGVGSARISGLMRVLVIDNYDSFTYNLVQYRGELGAEVLVRRNNEVTPGG